MWMRHLHTLRQAICWGSIKLFNLALQEIEKLPQDNTDIKYFTLKKRLAYSIGWIAKHERDNYNPESEEPRVALCSNPETDEKVLNLPDSPIEYIWLDLAQIEYTFGSGTTVLDHTWQIPDRNAYPALNLSLIRLQTQHDFRNKTFENLPRRIHQLVSAYASMQKHNQTGRGVEEKEIYSISVVDLSNFASVDHITVMLVTALLVRLRTNTDVPHILAIWRANSSELPIKENMFSALDLIESVLSGTQNNALAVIASQDTKHEKRLTAALKIVHNNETGPENLFNAHAYIALSLIGNTWEDPIVTQLAEIFSAQWLEKIKSPAMLQTPKITVPEIERACKGSEIGKTIVGKILLAAQQSVSIKVPSKTLQQFHSWTQSTQKQDAQTAKNPTAQRLIHAMEKPPHLTHEDVETLRQSIEEGKMPVKFDSLFEPGESEKQ